MLVRRCCANVIFFIAAIPCAIGQETPDPFALGSHLFEQGKFLAATEAFRQAVAQQPGRAPAWKALGVVYAAQRDYEHAEPAFGRACILKPELPDACLYHGRALYLLNRFRPAVAELRQALRRDASNAQLHRVLGLSLEALGDNSLAGTEFEAAIRLGAGSSSIERMGSPGDDPRIDYGVFLYRMGRPDEALTPLRAAFRDAPEVARTNLELGSVLLAMDRVDEAGTCLETAARLDPASSRTHLLLAKVYRRQGKPEAAEAQLRQGSETVR